MNSTVKLLVIDDDQADRLHLKRALRTCGFTCELTEYEEIHSVSDNLVNFDKLNTFDCIFLDYMLPGNNGLSLLKKIREDGIQTPIVIITSQGNESIAVELMKAGASDYVIKNEINGQHVGQILRNMFRIRKIVHEREDAEKALRHSESRLAEAQGIAKIGNWEFDPNSASIYCSDEVYNICDLEKSDVLLRVDELFKIVHSEDIDLVRLAWADALVGIKNINIDFRVLTSSGLKYAHCQGYALQDEDSRVKIIGTFQDITERKLIEMELLKAREVAENSMKVREVFLANMSHEIRTPMNAILGFTRLLVDSDLSKEQKSFIDAIHFSGENLLVIINDILDLSKIQSGKMTIEKHDFNIQELLTGILSVMRPKAHEKGLALTSKIDQQLPAVIKGDSVRLNQVLTNLISNAIKFTEAGSVILEINFTATEKDDISIEFRVTDSGIGIPEDKQAVVFDNFVQASSDITRKYGGTGLGLAIVKNLVDLQEGKISLTSRVGAGSTFIVHLPFQKVDQPVIEFGLKPKTSDGLVDQLFGTSILVVEDNVVNQLLARKVLEKAGCKVDTVANGLEALKSVKSERYDVVLMDIQMPEMDGYEATKHIRTKLSPPLCEIPIIAMTAHAFGSDVTRCISAGMNDYISKPFKAQDLYHKIVKYLSRIDQTKTIDLHQSEDMLKFKIDLTPMYLLGNGDLEFLNELILVYGKQTPAFIEKLRSYTKSQNFEAIAAICHQIKSSYGLVKMRELDDVLQEISVSLQMSKPELAKITNMVTMIISLISAINEELKIGLRQTA